MLSYALVLAVGFVAGTVSGIVGTGATVILLPVLVIVFARPEHVEQDGLQAVVRTGGIAGRRANAVKLLADQVRRRQMLVRIAPQTVADFGVQHFGEAFRQPVRQCL